MKLYKGFDKDLRCRDFQFEVGKTYEEPIANLCASGFHACENPLDVLDYYELPESRFAEVELDEVSEQRDGKDSKRVGKKIHIKAELNLKDFIKAGVEFLFEDNKAAKDIENGSKLAASGDGSQLAASGDGSKLAASGDGSKLAASGDRSQLAASGDGSKLAASGYGSKLAASGDGSKLAASGDGSKLAASGDGSKLAASGDRSQLAASGDGSKLAASGYGSKLAASGDRSQLAASGDGSKLAASGYGSVVMNAGYDGIAKAAKGSWITLVEWESVDGKWTPIHVVTKKVDGEKIKADTWYQLIGGKFKKVEGMQNG